MPKVETNLKSEAHMDPVAGTAQGIPEISGQSIIDLPAPAPIVRVVDDDDSFRTAIARLLRATNYAVRTYSNAIEFLSCDVEDDPGCILLDLRMPGPSGLALQETLATRPLRLPIIFLSGHGDLRATASAIEAGATDFLIKPVQRKDLLKAVEKALAWDLKNRGRRERAEA